MANGNDFKGGSPWGSAGGRNGSGRGGRRPPNIDEVVEKYITTHSTVEDDNSTTHKTEEDKE